MKRRGLRYPEDVSVTGINDMPYVDRFAPALTTIRVQPYRAGFEAAKLLVEAIDELPHAIDAPSPKSAAARSIVLPVELIVRESTRSILAPRQVEAKRA